LGVRADDKKPVLQGTWTLTKMELFGTVQDKVKQEGEFEIGDKTLVMKGKGLDSKFDCVFRPDKSPCQIDFLEKDGTAVVLHGIYKIEEDVLTICVVTSKHDRPTEFKTTKANEGIMFTLKRKK
jgi:uncharacterized protein (TIGR03067 family)